MVGACCSSSVVVEARVTFLVEAKAVFCGTKAEAVPAVKSAVTAARENFMAMEAG